MTTACRNALTRMSFTTVARRRPSEGFLRAAERRSADAEGPPGSDREENGTTPATPVADEEDSEGPGARSAAGASAARNDGSAWKNAPWASPASS